MRSSVRHPTAPTNLPIAWGVIASGRLLFISGQGPMDPISGRLTPGSFEEQVRLTLDNLGAVARAAGTDLSRAVKVNVYLRDMTNFVALNDIYREYFVGEKPARTTVQSDLDGFEIEVDAIIDADIEA